MKTPTQYSIVVTESAEGWSLSVHHLTPGVGAIVERHHERTQCAYSSPGDAITSARHLVKEVIKAREQGGKR